MTLVEKVIANWNDLPAKVQGAIAAAAGGALGYLELVCETGQGFPSAKQLLMHAGSAAAVGLLGYLVPNWKNRTPTPPPPTQPATGK